MTDNSRIIKTPKNYYSRIDTNKPQIGIIKDNVDPERMGRVRVWLKESTSPENSEKSWIWVNPSTPFGGATPNKDLKTSVENFDSTQKSYGFWPQAPFLEDEIIVIFINGDLRNAYSLGHIYHKNMNHMVPGIPQGETYQKTSEPYTDTQEAQIPVAEYNKLSENDKKRPAHNSLGVSLAKQGLLEDDLRGAGTSGARRESPSQVFGVLTQGGNQFIMDDGEGSEMIRLRTKSGVQILLSETSGNIYLISKDGNNWLELNNDGFVDLYGFKDISIRSEGNINIKANKDINMEADGDINIKSNGNNGIHLDSGSSNIELVSFNDIKTTAGAKLQMHSKQNLNILSNKQINITATESFNIDSLTVNTNVGSIEIPEDSNPIATDQKTDKRQFETSDGMVDIFDINVDTIVSRHPHHEPWPEHFITLAGFRENVEEGKTDVKKGSISKNAKKPLPVAGTPTKGMTEGQYEGEGFDKIGNPLYKLLGPLNSFNVNELKISPKGVEAIKKFEDFRSQTYKDVAGKATIGYGHLVTKFDNFPETGITETQATTLLSDDLLKVENAIRKNVTTKLTQNQFDSLNSFVYNTGVGAFKESTLLKELNTGNHTKTATEFSRWIYSKGKKVKGLISRRKAEALLFSSF